MYINLFEQGLNAISKIKRTRQLGEKSAMIGDNTQFFGWELWHLALWWATWSLADTYLLRFSPWAEVGVIITCILLAVASHVQRTCNVLRIFNRGVELKKLQTEQSSS